MHMARICQCGLALTIIASVLQESRNKFNFIPSSTRHAYRIKKKGKSDYDVQIDRGKYKYLNERR